MKKLLSGLLSLMLILSTGLTTLPQAHANSIQKSTILQFLSDNDLTDCFRRSPRSINRRITADELACLLMRSTGNPGIKTRPALRKAKLKGILPRSARATQQMHLGEIMDAGLKANGHTISPFINHSEWLFRDVKRSDKTAPAIKKAIEINIFSPVNGGELGFTPNDKAGRIEALTILYKLAQIHDGNQTIINITPLPTGPNVSGQGLDILLETMDQIQNKSLYRDRFDKTDGIHQAIKGLVKSLDDPYGEYYTPAENQEFFANLEGNLEGIGAYIEKREEDIVIVSPIHSSPAERAGVKAGDVVTHVNSVSVEGMSLQEVVNMIRGPKGTSVKLRIKRNGITKNFTITRDQIEVPSIVASDDNDVRVLKLIQFNNGAAQEFMNELERVKNNPPSGLVIDLRNNPGEFLHVVIQMLDMMVDKGLNLVQIKDQNSTIVTESGNDPIISNIPTVVLINQGSASASEILAGTLKDHGLATIVGETSFGKGSVQELISYYDGSSLKITTALWLTGGGASIDQVGVTPDVKIVDNPETEVDEALAESIKILRNGGGARRR